MSVEAISWALQQDIKHSSAKFVLVAMANCADGKEFLAWPSVAYLVEATAQDRKTVSANLARLRDAGYIEDTQERRGSTKQVIVYRLRNPKSGSVKEPQKRNSTENGTVPKTDGKRTEIPHKEAQISPETGPKTGHGTVKEPSRNRQGTVKPVREKATGFDALAVELPDWLPADAWHRWVKHRREIKKTLTEETTRQQLAKLKSWNDEGWAVVEIIDHAIGAGWQGLFLPNNLARPAGRGQPQHRASAHGNFARQDYRAGVGEDGSF